MGLLNISMIFRNEKQQRKYIFISLYWKGLDTNSDNIYESPSVYFIGSKLIPELFSLF